MVISRIGLKNAEIKYLYFNLEKIIIIAEEDARPDKDEKIFNIPR